MYFLGQGFGLDSLERDDFVGFGVFDDAEMMSERMNWDSIWDYRTPNDGEWGPGDQLGMYIAQMGSCF